MCEFSVYIRHSKLFHCQISIKSISIIIVTIFLLSIFYAINIAPRAYSRQSNDGVLTSNDTINGVTARWHSYTNSTYGVSLLYPPDWILSQVSQPNGTN